MKKSIAFSIPFVFCLATAFGDDILFKNGKSISGKVTEYKDGQITILKDDGKSVTGGIDKIDKIRFDTSPPPEKTSDTDSKNQQDDASKKVATSPAIRSQIAKAIDSAKRTLRPDQVVVAMYLDTPKPTDGLPRGDVSYRCYSGAGGGYSGIAHAPIRTGWTRIESLRPGDNGSRTIKLDPGPPYENIEIDVQLTAGEVTNLGRIVLKRVQVTGTASISGIVKDLEGNPIPDANVSAGVKKTKSGPDGKYQLDGFGLADVSVEATKKGYFCVPSQVSIRNMNERSIIKDVIVSRPIKLRLDYVVSSSGSDSFEGPGVEQGVIDLVVNKTHIPLYQLAHSSKLFERFVNDSRLNLSLLSGTLRFQQSIGPIFAQATSLDFESIKKAGAITSQLWPEITRDSTFIARGFSEWSQVSQHCVKFKVVELAFE